MKRLLLLLCLVAAPVLADDIKVVADGRRVKFDVAPVMQNGTVFVPLRGVFETMGASVSYNPATGVVKAHRRKTFVELRVGDPFARVNGESVAMMTPAGTLNGRTFVPLRFLSEVLGLMVEWHPVQRLVVIKTPSLPVNPGGDDDDDD